MRKKKTPKTNLSLAFFYSLIVLGLILLSFLLRGFVMIGESKFDGSNSFSLLVIEKNKEQVINFSPKSSSVYILDVNYIDNNINSSLDIPIDGTVLSDDPVNGENLSSKLAKMIFSFKDQKSVNFIDLLRLSVFSKSVNTSLISESSISRESDAKNLNLIISSFFIDPGISEEKQNIEIVNATDRAGLGNKLANLITNIGGNVILVTTGDLKDTSEIQYVNKTYTVKRLSSVLGFITTKTTKNSMPDVIIILGKDALSNIKF